MKVYEYLAAGPAGRRDAAAVARRRRRDRDRRRRRGASPRALDASARGRLARRAARERSRPRRATLGRAPRRDRGRARRPADEPTCSSPSHTPALGTGRAVRTYGVVARAGAQRARSRSLYVPLRRRGARAAVRARSPTWSLHPRRARRAARAGRSPTRGAGARRAADGFARGVSPELIAAVRRAADTPGRGRVIADGPIAAAAALPARAPAPGRLHRAQPRVGLRRERAPPATP